MMEDRWVGRPLADPLMFEQVVALERPNLSIERNNNPYYQSTQGSTNGRKNLKKSPL